MQQASPELKTYPPRIVGSVTTLEDWTALSRASILEQCDWAEIRLDTFPLHLSANELMEDKTGIPLLVTARSSSEGGKREMEDGTRFQLLRNFLPYAHAIDIEIASMDGAAQLIAEARASKTLVIASTHDFEKTPDLETLQQLEREGRSKGADIVKFAFMLRHPMDIATGIRLLECADGPMAVMGMGALGQTSRLLYSQLGSCLIYGYLGQYAAAPGQWPAKAFRDTLKTLPAAQS